MLTKNSFYGNKKISASTNSYIALGLRKEALWAENQ